MTSPAFLRQKAETATDADVHVARDLADTLAAYSDRCVGMAANMIGVNKRVIVFNDDDKDDDATTTMFNPEIVEKYGEYTTSEGCLSLDGERTTSRFRRIVVTFDDEKFHSHTATYDGWTAQIIQHEIDHCNGILI